ncbi:hypothetical protein Q3H58_005073 [Pseudomonas psychrotolerans]|uniref:Uracil DNA glycosylase superfamily protein n=2 Tax=Pseudomonas oryzihabitans TaxID=47885 RepID=A0AAJ2EXW5_9PSED|nr:hypothetical protein [Pseudomonas psychrotolerans]MDR6358402.1 hypothetical protein [Pseudomonas psychrotolerans]
MRTLTSDCVSFLTSTLPYAPSISISSSQRKLKMGYHRVARYLDVLAKAGYLSSETEQRKTALKFWQSSPILDLNHLLLGVEKISAKARHLLMQDLLKAIYEDYKQRVSSEIQDLSVISPPLLLSVPEKWTKSKTRILIVGQETLGWDFSDGSYYPWPHSPITNFEQFALYPRSVSALMQGYVEFEFSRFQRENVNSPYWRAYRHIRQAMGEEAFGFDSCVLTTNLFRMAFENGSAVYNGTKEQAEEMNRLSGTLLVEEISILEPTAVIFFTGPRYESYLMSQFTDMEFSAISDIPISRMAYVHSSSLPKLSFRTYHPSYLSRSRQWHFLDNICDLIKTD